MVDVLLSAEARADMLDLHAQSMLQFGADVADKYIDGVDATLARLADFPQSGPFYPGIRPPVRVLAHRRHHIIYEFDGTTVWVVRILHHAMDAGRHL